VERLARQIGDLHRITVDQGEALHRNRGEKRCKGASRASETNDGHTAGIGVRGGLGHASKVRTRGADAQRNLRHNAWPYIQHIQREESNYPGRSSSAAPVTMSLDL